MVIILVVLSFAVAIVVDAMVIKKLAENRARQMVVEQTDLRESVPLKKNLQDVLFHEGHTWARVRRAVVDVGLDTFTKNFIGEITKIDALPLGTEVAKGKKVWTIHFGDRSLTQLAPISGRVIEVNKNLIAHPAGLEPTNYTDSWLVRILPEALNQELPSLYTPARYMKWVDLQKTWLARDSFADLGVVYGDGEQMVEGAARQIDKDKWELVARKLFGFEL